MNRTNTMYRNARDAAPTESYSAREFALMSHNLGRKAETATTPDGKRFAWDKAAERWVRYV